jgi:HD-like signal output (HDOD) protein
VHIVYPESLAFMRVLGTLQGRLSSLRDVQGLTIQQLMNQAAEAAMSAKTLARRNQVRVAESIPLRSSAAI